MSKRRTRRQDRDYREAVMNEAYESGREIPESMEDDILRYAYDGYSPREAADALVSKTEKRQPWPRGLT